VTPALLNQQALQKQAHEGVAVGAQKFQRRSNGDVSSMRGSRRSMVEVASPEGAEAHRLAGGNLERGTLEIGAQAETAATFTPPPPPGCIDDGWGCLVRANRD
jgi:hypothetical protein